MKNLVSNASRALAAVSAFLFTGLVRFFAGLFCYRYYSKTQYDRLKPLLLA